MTVTTRERIAALLGFPTRPILTASQIRNVINDHSAADKQVRLSSVSSLLKKMVDTGEIERHENFGPRGGYGYCTRKP